MTVQPTALPMKEALKFWTDKKVVSAEEFAGLSAVQRQRAFAVSGIASMDMMADVHASLYRALAEGKSLGSWKKEMAETWEKLGWTGKNAWRLDNIFRTNVQTAFSVGRYEQMSRVKQRRPYWRYSAVGDKRTRPTHAALNGKVFHADNPFWDTFYPPNGFRCRCSVTTLSERQVKARGIKVEEGNPYGELIEPVDPVTGAKLPARPLMPDPGFGTNPAKDYLAGLTPSEIDAKDVKPVRVGKAICRQDGGPVFAEGDICRPPLAGIDARHVLTVAEGDIIDARWPKEKQVLEFLKTFGLTSIDDSTVVRLPGNYPLVVSKWMFMDKATGDWKKTWADKGPYMKLLARTILNPYEAWWQPVEIGAHRRLVYSLRLIRLFASPDGQGIAGYGAFHLIGRQWEGATAFAPYSERSEKAMLKYLEKMRGGILIYRETLA